MRTQSVQLGARSARTARLGEWCGSRQRPGSDRWSLQAACGTWQRSGSGGSSAGHSSAPSAPATCRTHAVPPDTPYATFSQRLWEPPEEHEATSIAFPLSLILDDLVFPSDEVRLLSSDVTGTVLILFLRKISAVTSSLSSRNLTLGTRGYIHVAVIILEAYIDINSVSFQIYLQELVLYKYRQSYRYYCGLETSHTITLIE